MWRAAAAEFATAKRIVVSGFSLPQTDSFFRYLYALGTISDERIRAFRVYDPDPSGDVEKRFRALLGDEVLARFVFLRHTFQEAIGEIWNKGVAGI